MTLLASVLAWQGTILQGRREGLDWQGLFPSPPFAIHGRTYVLPLSDPRSSQETPAEANPSYKRKNGSRISKGKPAWTNHGVVPV